MHLDHIDELEHRIGDLSERVDAVIAPLAPCSDLLVTIPCFSKAIAETGADMTQFPTAAHLASWAGARLAQ